MATINLEAKVGPYVGVSRDEVKTLEDGRKFRIVLYGAYNAMGLIGSECNGIVILNEDDANVVCDEIGRTSTGYFGPTVDQQTVFNLTLEMDDQQFIEFVNTVNQRRLRYRLE